MKTILALLAILAIVHASNTTLKIDYWTGNACSGYFLSAEAYLTGFCIQDTATTSFRINYDGSRFNFNNYSTTACGGDATSTATSYKKGDCVVYNGGRNSYKVTNNVDWTITPRNGDLVTQTFTGSCTQGTLLAAFVDYDAGCSASQDSTCQAAQGGANQFTQTQCGNTGLAQSYPGSASNIIFSAALLLIAFIVAL
ncbi:hypothetical protein PROFUN_06626 [Planoprotostelium fungivorum]|uniref:Uncharacterized protein n=1 Tax=Planoprotostelium fungivorum TaxID=1890364 RepID=A0A2P6MST7_9EUKA|nr:hypothetical protein PROFUN_06626 [Planoprotostelium fungivorum]